MYELNFNQVHNKCKKLGDQNELWSAKILKFPWIWFFFWIYHRCTLTKPRAGSAYTSVFQKENESKKKHLKSLGELHYDKSSTYYSLAGNDNVCDRLRVLLEHVALLEFHFECMIKVGQNQIFC